MSIWQDEALSLYRATKPLSFILSGRIDIGALATKDVQPPLYFLLLAAWFRLLGTGTWLAKYLSYGAGLLCLVLVWVLGRRWLGERVATVAAWFSAISPLFLWYSQEIRSYTLQVALALLAVYGLARACTAGGRRRGDWLVLTALANAALLWTHYLGFLLLAFEAFYVMVQGAQHRSLAWFRDRRWWLAALLVGLAALPLLPFAVWRLGLGAETDQKFVPLPIILGDLVHGFTFGWEPHPERVLWIDALVALVLLYALVRLGRERRPAVAFLLGLLLIPALGIFAITLVKPVYMGVRHIMIASPAYFLLLAVGLLALSRHALLGGIAVGAAIAAGMVYSCIGFYADPAYRKDDLRALAQYVARGSVPGDVLAVSDLRLVLAFEHLEPGVPVIALPATLADGRLDDRPPAEQLAGVMPTAGRLWFMTPSPEFKAWLEAARPRGARASAEALPVRARLVDQRAFVGRTIPVRVDVYEALQPVGAELAQARPVQKGPPGLALHWTAQPLPAVAGRTLRVRLYAPTLSARPANANEGDESRAPPLGARLSLRLLDDNGATWSQADHDLVRHDYPAFDGYPLYVEPITPPGSYRLTLDLYLPNGQLDERWTQSLLLGHVTVFPTTKPARESDLAIRRRIGARGGGVRLLGFDLGGRRVPAGAELSASLWLRVVALPVRAEAIRLELLDAWGRPVTSATAPLASAPDSLSGWRPGDVRRLRVRLGTPATPGRYGLRASVLASGRRIWLWCSGLPVRAVWLDWVTVAEHPASQPHAPQYPLSARFGDQVVLGGYDLPLPPERWSGAAAKPVGATVPITLHWSVLTPPTVNYAVSVQLVPARRRSDGPFEPSGPPVSQHDGEPAQGTRPSRGWRSSQTILDRHELPWPAELRGDYLLIAALYDPASPGQSRLTVRQGDQERDYAVLATIQVAQGRPTWLPWDPGGPR